MNNQQTTTNHQQQRDLVAILKEDYQHFPENQTFDIYADNVYFKDPLNEFRGVKKYQAMIGFLNSFFINVEMEVHDMSKQDNSIKTEWTLNMTPPLPWKPRLSIPGWSELGINGDNLISSHVDYWHISPWNVLRQNFFSGKKASQ
ncbi:DUF2358 domain-containing protein [Pleurocapsa sp. FMAR1]|uniref:DUF2358 domain-containing protein n=1 Tax=Pleurocapsa sp. FMAR1 TaxID=3040204 RepID=UPI0029C7E6A9|nr:DUF2358 domain-containing protein [Pleurocapsa sp. FMAR1]